MDFDGGELQTREAGCPGVWVMLAALSRREAGELHALAGRPKETLLQDPVWKIQVVEAPEETAAGGPRLQEEKTLGQGTEERLQKALSFRYPHEAATQAPSKQTATGRKDREKDKEAAELAAPHRARERAWRKPSFVEKAVQGKIYGTAIHSAMQYLDFRKCGTYEGLQMELQRILDQGLLSADQGKLADPQAIWPFFETEIGKKLVSGGDCLREFKFSILDDGSHYGEGLEGEQVLLQGVVDCALLEPVGITLVDFKTDYVTEATLETVKDRYRIQLATYAMALERIYERPVKESLLYFFHLNRFESL